MFCSMITSLRSGGMTVVIAKNVILYNILKIHMLSIQKKYIHVLSFAVSNIIMFWHISVNCSLEIFY